MEKKCKKCERILPDGYKKNICENCKNNRVQSVKGGIGAVAGLAATIVLARFKKK